MDAPPSKLTSGRRKRNVDGGWAYMILLATMGFFFMYGGLSKSLGVMLPTLKEQLNTQTWLLGSILSIKAAIRDIAAIPATVLSRKIPIRYIVTASSIMIACGMIFASLAQTVTEFAVFLCVFQGLGFGLSIPLMQTIIGYYFNKKYAFAYGVSSSGIMLGFIIMAPLTQLLLDVYGWRGTLLVISSISLNLIAFSALTRPVVNHKTGTAESEDNLKNVDEGTVNPERIRSSKSCVVVSTASVIGGVRSFLKTSDLSLFNEFSFIVVLIHFCTLRFLTTALIIYLVPHAVDMGFGNYEASLFATVFGIGGIIGKVVYGPLVDRMIITRRTMLFLSTSFMSAILFVDHLLTSMAMMIAANLILGACSGIANCMVMVINRRVVGIDRFANSIAWTSFVSVGFRILAGFVPGWIFDQTSSYNKVFVILGGVLAISPAVLVVEGIYKRFCVKKVPIDPNWECVLR